MVVPDEIIDAAEEGDVAAVRDWLASGGNVNDADDGDETLLTTISIAVLSDAHLDLARLLLERGADVNQIPNVNSFSPLHLCALFSGSSRRVLLLKLFLENGADVNLAIDTHTPLELLLQHCTWFDDQAARLGLDSARCLLRAGATLGPIDESGRDCAQRSMDTNKWRHAASMSAQELSSHFYACKTLISDYRAAGSTWKGYVRAPPKELLRLRSLLARGRARERKARTRRATPREVALLFAPTFPNELFWKVATYWNPRY